MSFDLLVTLLFILFFVLGPLFQRSGRGRQQRPQSRPPRPASPPEDEQRPAGMEGPLAERLEEARRRVLEAMGESPAAERRDPEPSRAERQPERQGVDWQKPAGSLDWQPPPSTPSRTSELDWQKVSRPAASFIAAREGRTPSRASAPRAPAREEVRTERLRKRAGTAKLRSGGFPALGKDDIINGMIWHEILSPPVTKRASRRQPSRLRSP